MTRICLLCPGPSLERFAGQDEFTIGVNRVVKRHVCDVWSCCDYDLISKIRGDVLGNPVLFTTGSSIKYLRENSPAHDARKFDALEYSSLTQFCPPALRWETFSSTAALVYAAHHANGEPASIHCYGVDWCGELDWDGTGGFANRSPGRWQREAEIWHGLTAWLSEREISVIRH